MATTASNRCVKEEQVKGTFLANGQVCSQTRPIGCSPTGRATPGIELDDQ